MNGAELKERVHGGGIVYGTMISMGRNPRWTSAFANFGIDYVIVDTEHSPRGQDGCRGLYSGVHFQRGGAYRADSDTGLALCDDGAGRGRARGFLRRTARLWTR